jgi:hypothetical protein
MSKLIRPPCFKSLAAAMLLASVIAIPSGTVAAEPGKAVGTFTYDGTTVTLANATEIKVEGLFDSSKQDLLVVLTDRPLGSTAADDDIDLSLRARKGDLAALMLRIDGPKLINVSVFHKGLSGKVVLPGAWFDYKAAKPGTGSLKLTMKEFDGHKYATTVEFAAMAAPKPAPAPPPPAVPAAKPASAPAPPAAAAKPAPAEAPKPPSPAILVKLLMDKDEAGALEVIKLGVDPNGKDQYGVPMLNWAVMMCQPKVVKALVDKKADLKYERSPGLTILTEAGACPEAAKILKAAGAK